jgi:adenylate cyclase class 2
MDNKELEIKFLNINIEQIRTKLISIGAQLITSEYIMKRKTFDFSKISPNKNKWGRVRQEADKTTMTVKEITGNTIEDVLETEIMVDDFNKACKIFEECGINSKSFQENKREEWEYKNTSITIDTWPGLPTFIEIESNSIDSIKQTSEKLGYDYNYGVFGSIDFVYEKILKIPKEEIIILPEITFQNPPIKKVV